MSESSQQKPKKKGNRMLIQDIMPRRRSRANAKLRITKKRLILIG